MGRMSLVKSLGAYGATAVSEVYVPYHPTEVIPNIPRILQETTLGRIAYYPKTKHRFKILRTKHTKGQTPRQNQHLVK